MSATLAEVEAKIRAAMDAAKARGYCIKSGAYLNRGKSWCCAVGAAVIDDTVADAYTAAERASYALDLSMEQVGEIARGFDDDDQLENDKDLYELGRRLRADYLWAP